MHDLRPGEGEGAGEGEGEGGQGGEGGHGCRKGINTWESYTFKPESMVFCIVFLAFARPIFGHGP